MGFPKLNPSIGELSRVANDFLHGGVNRIDRLYARSDAAFPVNFEGFCAGGKGR